MSNEDQLARNQSLADGGIDALLAASLDDLDDLPSFDVPPNGSYILDISADVKEINDKSAVEFTYLVKETVELKDSGEQPAAPGTKFSTLYTLNPFGIGKLKKDIAPFAQHFECNNIGELVRDHIKDVTVSAVVGRRSPKDDPEKVYANVKVIAVV